MTQNPEKPLPPNVVTVYEAVLEEFFDVEELKILCFYAGVNYDDLGGEGRRAKALQLVKHFERRLPQLVQTIKKLHPDSPLGDAPAAAEAETARAVALGHLIAAYISAPPSSSPQPTSPAELLPAAMRPGGAAATGEFRPRVHLQTRDELVLISEGREVEMMRLVSDIMREARARGIGLRAGLHSEAAPQGVDQQPAATEDEPDAAAIKTARLVGRLGEAGHVLATRRFAEVVGAAGGEELVIDALGRRKIGNDIIVGLSNIYNRAGLFGNPGSPRTYLPAPVVKEVDIPKELRCARPRPLKIVFYPNVEYARVTFVKDENIEIACEQQGNAECTFDYYRQEGHYEKDFEVWAVRAKSESLEPIDIIILDEDGEMLSPSIRRSILLRRRTPDPSGLSDVFRIPLWARDRFVCFPLWARALLVTALVVGMVFFGLLRYDPEDRRCMKEAFLMATIWPGPFQGEWPEMFTNAADSSLDDKAWDAPSKWVLVKAEGTDTSDKLLSVDGPGVGLTRERGLYDFNANLRILVLEGQRQASWILRAKDAECYYLFVLTFPPQEGTAARLEGFVYEDGKPVEKLSPNNATVEFYHPFRPNTLLFVDITAEENVFKHVFKIDVPDTEAAGVEEAEEMEEAPSAGPPADPNEEYVGVERPATLTDHQQFYRYGSIGFGHGEQPGGAMKIDWVKITNARPPSRCANRR